MLITLNKVERQWQAYQVIMMANSYLKANLWCIENQLIMIFIHN